MINDKVDEFFILALFTLIVVIPVMIAISLYNENRKKPKK